jgi:hypothetical protein
MSPLGAHSGDDRRRPWRPVIGVVLPPLWHKGRSCGVSGGIRPSGSPGSNRSPRNRRCLSVQGNASQRSHSGISVRISHCPQTQSQRQAAHHARSAFPMRQLWQSRPKVGGGGCGHGNRSVPRSAAHGQPRSARDLLGGVDVDDRDAALFQRRAAALGDGKLRIETASSRWGTRVAIADVSQIVSRRSTFT